jgi:hypothetical protein
MWMRERRRKKGKRRRMGGEREREREGEFKWWESKNKLGWIERENKWINKSGYIIKRRQVVSKKW